MPTMNPSSDLLPLPLPYDMNSMFLDVMNRYISIQNTIFDDNFNCFDRTEIRFTLFGDMTYRGQLYSPKENFNNLSLVLREIYEKDYRPPPPNPQADYTTYREPQKEDSGSSHGSSKDKSDSHQHHSGGHDQAQTAADGTLAASLLKFPINIDGKIPLSRSYQQFEPRGFKLITDGKSVSKDYENSPGYAHIAAGLSRKRKQFGFSREEIMLYGGLSCTPCRPSNLSDPFITTIFRQENFYDTPQDVYDSILPCLKLAEKFITDPTLIGYWSTLAFGKRVIDMKLTARHKVCCERIVTSTDMTEDIYAQTLHLLNRLGKLVEFRFPQSNEFVTCFGFTERAERKWNLA